MEPISDQLQIEGTVTMKKRFWIFVLVLTVIIFAFVLFRGPTRPPVTPDTKQPPVESPKASTNNTARPQRVAANLMPTTNTATPTPEQIDGERRLKLLQQFAAEKNVPLDFHGQFIDQDSNALAGVEIKVWVDHWFVGTPPRNIVIDTKSGPDGRFWLNGEKGDGFDIQLIQKDGYEVEPGQRTFSALGGSFDNPIVFKMWSTNVHEKLITGSKNFQIVPDGRSYFIDFSTGSISESGPGDLRVWIKYPLQALPGKVYEWSSEINVVNGGLLEVTNGNESMFFAPTIGYTNTYRCQRQMEGGKDDWMNVQRFYLNLNSGHEYGRMKIGLCGPYNKQIPGMVSIGYSINPSGSRVLR